MLGQMGLVRSKNLKNKIENVINSSEADIIIAIK